MKKFSMVAVMAMAALALGSCSKSAPKANLESDIDSLSYAFGIEQSQGVRQFLQQMEIDSTYMNQFVQGITDGANGAEDNKKKAYNAGIMIGQQIVMMQKNFSRQIFEGDSTKSLSKDNFIAGFLAGATGNDQKMTPEQARMIGQQVTQAIQMKQAEVKFGKEKKAADAFMAANAKKEGIKLLGKGVQYKVLKEGKGAIPTADAMVSINYEGKTIDGKTFDKRDGSKMPVGGVIPGFTEVLTHMPVGSKWEVYIPYSAGYGAQQVSADLKPFSTLIFTIELLGIEEKPAAPAGVPAGAAPKVK